MAAAINEGAHFFKAPLAPQHDAMPSACPRPGLGRYVTQHGVPKSICLAAPIPLLVAV